MASFAQLLANRLNALKSTGPKTLEGKARSSRNATTHGLSRAGAHPPAALAEAIAGRRIAWQDDYRPEGPAQQWAFDRLVAESVRLDFCEGRIFAARLEHAERASESWDDDQAAAIAERASRLSKRPEVIQPALLQSKHGVLWLLERWDEVAASLHRHDGWIPETWALACDLLGLPLSAREGSGPWDLDPEDSSAAPGLALVRQSVVALQARLDNFLDARDSRARLDAELGLSADDPPPIRLLERYAADARRQFARNLTELRRLQLNSSRAPSTPAPVVAAASPPGPRPDRSGRRTSPDLDHQGPPPAPPNPEPTPATNPSPVASSSAPDSRSPGLGTSLRNRLQANAPASNRRARRAARAVASRRS